jgi:hypothetical protein
VPAVARMTVDVEICWDWEAIMECLGGSLCVLMVCSGLGDASDGELDGFEVVGGVVVVLDEMSA